MSWPLSTASPPPLYAPARPEAFCDVLCVCKGSRRVSARRDEHTMGGPRMKSVSVATRAIAIAATPTEGYG